MRVGREASHASDWLVQSFRKDTMIEQTERNGMKSYEFTLGDGDVFIGVIKLLDKETPTGIVLMDFPDGKHKVNETFPEVCGEDISCLAAVGTKIWFRTSADIDFFINDLNRLKEQFKD